MARRRNEPVASLLLTLPWWASLLAAALAYVAIRFLVPTVSGGGVAWKALAPTAEPAAPLIACALALVAPVAYLRQLRNRRRLDRKTGIESILALSWEDFELLLGEAFRRQGFWIEARDGAEDGIDLILRRDGALTLVQCTHWRAQQVGVSSVRELYRAMQSAQAYGGLVVTSGRFTGEAKLFAADKPVGLIGGDALLELMKPGDASIPESARDPSSPPPCPRCSRPMVLRAAQRSARSGKIRWGCPAYPSCNGTRPLAASRRAKVEEGKDEGRRG
jgi:restriction system protein